MNVVEEVLPQQEEKHNIAADAQEDMEEETEHDKFIKIDWAAEFARSVDMSVISQKVFKLF
jgi:hypothetical protein